MAEPGEASPSAAAAADTLQRCLRIVGEHVAVVADELGAAMAEMNDAASGILSACEGLERALAGTAWDRVGGVATALIYQACSFHDVAGQRIAKVASALRLMEARLADPGRTVGHRDAGMQAPDLLNGPQHPRDALGQGVVDRMLAGHE